MERAADSKYTKKYHFEVCADLVDDTALDILKNVPDGNFEFEIGIQSTNRETLLACGRTSFPEKTVRQMTKLYELRNIKIHADLIAGLPHESYARFAQSFNSVYGKCDELQLGFLKLLYGTDLRKKAESFGCVFSDNPPYTVLQTDCIIYPEIELLRDISDVLTRFAESGRFKNTIGFLLDRTAAPFTLFEGIAKYIKEKNPAGLRGISQRLTRFAESGRFKNTIGFLLDRTAAPFTLFEGIAKYIKEKNPAGLRGISQRKAYEELFFFGLNTVNSIEDRCELFERISQDFEKNEVGRLPVKIRNFLK